MINQDSLDGKDTIENGMYNNEIVIESQLIVFREYGMRKRRWIYALLILIISTMACSVPFPNQEEKLTETAVYLQAAAAQTIMAQQADLTMTALAQGVDVTATALAQSPNATQTALSAQETMLSLSVNATWTALALDATVAAQAAQATVISLAQTATAQAYNPPPPPPPPLPPTSEPFPPDPSIRLSFATGATSAVMTGQIRQNQIIHYLVRALMGQTMMVTVYSPSNNVYLGIVGLADGIPLIRTAADSVHFTGVLQGTQDYQISLFSADQNSNYTLQVIIPARIQFAPGTISGNVNGFLNGGEVNYYLANARAGQQMSVSIFSPGNDIFLTIYGMEDGSPLIRSVAGQSSWTGILPGTQDYMIEAVSTGPSANYTVQVTIQ